METGLFAQSTLMGFVSSAKAQLNIQTADSDIYLERLANEGIRHLDTLSIFVKKQCKLKVNNNMAKLPDGYSRLIGARVCSGNIWGQLIYVDLPFLHSCGVDCNMFNVVPITASFQIQGNYILISNNLLGVDEDNNPVPITDIDLAYFGLNVDQNGMMIGYDDYERAITAYICYKYTLQNFDRYNQYVIDEYRQEWAAQKKWVKGKDVQDHFNNTKRQIAATMNAWIASKIFTA